MLPEGWKLTSAGRECFSIVSGRNKPQEFSGNIPWITLPEIAGCYVPSYKQTKYISKDTIQKSGAKLVPQGSVVISIAGELGLVAIAKSSVTLNQQLHAFVCKKSINNEFFAQYIRMQKNFLYQRASKTTIPYLNKENCESIPILLPPLPEQKKIAAILSTWDRAIEGTERLLANSQKQKKALMQQLLTGKKRLPDFAGEWAIKKLDDIANIQTGSSNRQDASSNGIYTFFDRSEEIRKSNRYLFDCEAVIVPGEGQNFIPKYFFGKFDLHQRTYAISGFRECDGKFIFYLISHNKAYFLAQAVGSTVKSLRLPMFQKMTLEFPPLPEQKAIAAVLTTADNEITTIEVDLARLRQEKKALMQQLLTGKRRVTID
ncbi:restriction endonuclease subunit S [Saccharibacter sp. 17.LH.SD]|uniref:restriction endonuclease subunit S n=1 Tax=Saccharibacter sp. 17.LH.SD TaxID=2689393 RepID=UPI00136A03A6|nr:restriction endonuclease subunit S [Saccharibacter sp. 17.LH.SD]MXV44279.1 restriction endonuclease subunit S [Saccharibacter sp. 17.LH.SD]